MNVPSVSTPGIDLQRLVADADHDGVSKLVVGAIVHSGGRVLILRRSPDDFLPGIEELPSGGAEPGENLADALARELAEEIGWTGPVSLDPCFVTHFDYRSGSARLARQFTFGLSHDGRPVVLSAEHTGFRWIDPEGLDASDLTAETAQTIRDWAGRAR